MCAAVSLNVRNAFNTLSWKRVLKTVEEWEFPAYLLKMVQLPSRQGDSLCRCRRTPGSERNYGRSEDNGITGWPFRMKPAQHYITDLISYYALIVFFCYWAPRVRVKTIDVTTPLRLGSSFTCFSIILAAGVLQGLVLGSLLRNLSFDRVSKLTLTKGAQTICFADITLQIDNTPQVGTKDQQ